jgi:hypothetical protein
MNINVEAIARRMPAYTDVNAYSTYEPPIIVLHFIGRLNGSCRRYSRRSVEATPESIRTVINENIRSWNAYAREKAIPALEPVSP